MLLRSLALLLAGGIALSACGSGAPETPRTPSTPSTGPGEQITGRERLGWDQPASDVAELASLRYAVYVDGVRVELTSVSCAATATSAGFACTAALPPLSAGAHALALAAFILDGNTVLESGRSMPLQVVVVAAAADAPRADRLDSWSPAVYGSRIAAKCAMPMRPRCHRARPTLCSAGPCCEPVPGVGSVVSI